MKLSVYVPETHLESLKDALFAAGAGSYGQYDRCCWQTLGTGQFRPLPGNHAFIGETGTTCKVNEYKLEMICKDSKVSDVMKALKQAHPYEEPAFSFVKIDIPSEEK